MLSLLQTTNCHDPQSTTHMSDPSILSSYPCDFEDSIIEVQAINTCLERMGANEEYCTNYFKSAGGECLKKCGSMCMVHSACCAPLPPNKMCAKEFGKRVCMLNREISMVEVERENLKQACAKLKSRAAREDEADAYPPVVEEESRKVGTRVLPCAFFWCMA